MLSCKCCRCSKSIESLDLSKPHKEMIKKREKKLTDAEAKSYKKLRLSSFIPESYFVNAQQMNCATTSQIGDDFNEQLKQIKKLVPYTNQSETKPKSAFQTVYEDEMVSIN